jgi:hypothetical protein
MLTDERIEELVGGIRKDNKRTARILLEEMQAQNLPHTSALKLSDPPTQEEVQKVVDRINELIAALNGE